MCSHLLFHSEYNIRYVASPKRSSHGLTRIGNTKLRSRDTNIHPESTLPLICTPLTSTRGNYPPTQTFDGILTAITTCNKQGESLTKKRFHWNNVRAYVVPLSHGLPELRGRNHETNPNSTALFNSSSHVWYLTGAEVVVACHFATMTCVYFTTCNNAESLSDSVEHRRAARAYSPSMTRLSWKLLVGACTLFLLSREEAKFASYSLFQHKSDSSPDFAKCSKTTKSPVSCSRSQQCDVATAWLGRRLPGSSDATLTQFLILRRATRSRRCRPTYTLNKPTSLQACRCTPWVQESTYFALLIETRLDFEKDWGDVRE